VRLSLVINVPQLSPIHFLRRTPFWCRIILLVLRLVLVWNRVFYGPFSIFKSTSELLVLPCSRPWHLLLLISYSLPCLFQIWPPCSLVPYDKPTQDLLDSKAHAYI
jgi:hypothetical protein